MDIDPFASLTRDDISEAITQGVENAFWRLMTNTTDMPCTDFYQTVHDGIRDAVKDMEIDHG